MHNFTQVCTIKQVVCIFSYTVGRFICFTGLCTLYSSGLTVSVQCINYTVLSGHRLPLWIGERLNVTHILSWSRNTKIVDMH